MPGFSIDDYLGGNTKARLPDKMTAPATIINKPGGLSMTPALEWALRQKHADAANIITNNPPGTAGGGINLRRTANDVKKKEKKEEVDPGFLIKYLPFLLILAVVLYFFLGAEEKKPLNVLDGIYKPNEALLYARNISCEIQPR